MVYTANNLFDPRLKERNKDGICDSGSTLHCLCMDSPSINDHTNHRIIRATQPDGTHITSSMQCDLKIPNLPPGTRTAYKFKTLAGNSLISLPIFADQGCTITLDKDKVVVTKHGNTIMSGYREKSTGLWRIPLDDEDDVTVRTSNTTKTHSINSISPDGTVREVLEFLSKALFSPTQSTLVKAIENGHLATWPLLTKANVTKFLPNSQETALGHLDQQRKNTRSTQPRSEEDQ